MKYYITEKNSLGIVWNVVYGSLEEARKLWIDHGGKSDARYYKVALMELPLVEN